LFVCLFVCCCDLRALFERAKDLISPSCKHTIINKKTKQKREREREKRERERERREEKRREERREERREKRDMRGHDDQSVVAV